MATLYWVGGSGNWNDPLNWSEVSGGFANTNVTPTVNDDVIFDENSGTGAYAVTITGSDLRVRDVTVNETATIYPQFAVNSRLLIYGDLVLADSSPQTTFTSNGSELYFISNSANLGTKTINTKGVDLRRVYFDASGYATTFSLASNLTASTYIILTNSSTTFTTNNYTLNVNTLQNTSGSVTINLGSSNVNITNSTGLFFTVTGTTINAGTSTITFASTVSQILLYGTRTLYNVVFSSRTSDMTYTSAGGTTTFNNLTINGPSTAREYTFAFDGNVVINGVFTIATGVTGASRVNLWNSTSFLTDSRTTTQRTVTVNGSVSLTDATFSNINFQGSAAPVSGTRLGDLGNNTNLNAATPKTVYLSATGNQAWTNDIWSNSSGGTPSRIYYPLPQDTAIIDDNSGSSINSTAGVEVFPGINGLSRSTSYQLTINSAIRFVKDLLSGPNVGISGGNNLYFSDKTSSTIDINATAASLQHFNLFVTAPNSTLRLVNDFSLGNSGDLNIYDGDFILNGYSLTCEQFNVPIGASALDVNVENSSLFINSMSIADPDPSLLTANSYIEVRGGLGRISVDESISSQYTFNDVTFTGDYSYSSFKGIRGRDLVFNTLTIEPPSSDGEIEFRIFHDLTTSTIEVENLNIGGTANNAIRRVALTRAVSSGLEFSVPDEDLFTLRVNSSFNLEDVDFLRVKVSDLGLYPLTGTRLGDLGGNENITFDAPKTVYWVGTGSNRPYHSDSWASSSGGAADESNFPLPQDMVIFDDAVATPSDQVSITQNLYIPDVDFSSRTEPLAIIGSRNKEVLILGNFELNSAITNNTSSSNGYEFVFAGTNRVQNINTAGQPFYSVAINGANTEVVLLDDLTINFYSGSPSWANRITLSNGTFSPGSNDVNIGSIFTSASQSTNFASNEAVLNFGSGVWSLSSTSTSSSQGPIVFSNTDFGKITINPDTATIRLTGGSTSTSGAPIITRGADLPKIDFASNNYWNFITQGDFGTTTFPDFTNSSPAPKILFSSGQGDAFFDAFNINGESVNSLAVLDGNNNDWTFNGSGFVSVDNVLVRDTRVFPQNNWVAGVNSTNDGNNIGWIFLQRKDPTYFVTSSIEEASFESRYAQYCEIGQRSPRLTSGDLYGWGRNNVGQLGDGTTSGCCTTPIPISIGSNWRKVSSADTSFAIKKDGSLWGWGCNNYGNLGDGTSVGKSVPTEVSGSNTWSAVSQAESRATAAIDTSKKLWTWGKNDCGALGRGSSVEADISTTPSRICDKDSTWHTVSAGNRMFLAIKTDNTLWGWGRNAGGRIGDSSTTSRCSVVQEITSSSNWCAVDASQASAGFSGAIKTNGTLWTWGCGAAGALGQGTTTNKSSPAQISGGSYVWCSIAVGNLHGSALKTNGTLWSWGQNVCGELGVGNTVNSCSPVQEITSSIDWKFVSAGNFWKAAIKTSGQLWTWGGNGCGELGDGTTLDKCSPVREFTSSTSWREVSGNGSPKHGIQFS